MQLVGQENNIDIINKWSTMPNFVIIQGENHSGREFMTLYFCNKFKLHYVPVKNSVKEVRALINVMSPNSNTVYHFKNFDTATLQAKNALLKVTEEPVPGNYIVITGGPQLPTLESRARRIIMEPYKLEDMVKYMDPYFSKDVNKEQLYIAGINTPAKVEYYKKYEKLQNLLTYTLDVFNKITYITPNDFIAMLGNFENRYDADKTDACLLFINMLIKLTEHKIQTNHYYSYRYILDCLLDGKKQLLRENTLNRKLLIFRIFYNIYKGVR